jgi:Trypsin-like peptidase domain
MDRRQMVMQRAREFFGDRLDDVLPMVQQDRQELRGWQEPAHLRAAVRRTVRAEGDVETMRLGETAVADALTPAFDFGRPAAEPDLGQQREAIGLLLECGASALQKMQRGNADLTPEETFGLEAVLLLYARPALLMAPGQMFACPPFWNLMEDQRDDIELVQRGVGRIEMFGHPEFDWAGTGFLVAPGLLLTTRRTAELFAECKDGNWQFRPGISAWMDYRSGYQNVSNAGYRVRNVLGCTQNYDLAVLEVEGTQVNGQSPVPLPLACEAPTNLFGRLVYLVGYPCRDARRNEPEPVSRIFRDVYNVKRVQPGQLRGDFRFAELPFLRHDCAPLGVTCGAPVIDLETHQVVGVQVTGRYLETSTAVPVYALQEDPLFRRCNVPFTNTRRAEEKARLNAQVERLSRSSYWNEVRDLVEGLYQRAFGRPTV